MKIILFHKNRLNFIVFFLVVLLHISSNSVAQNVDVGNLKSTFNKANAIKITGGLNANLISYSGNSEANRDPYTWYVGGNVNISLFGKIDLPFSLNLTNAGSNLNLPTSPNMISLNPTYKWVTAHIGSVNMSFSPYTLNGHQFNGVGVDLTPKGNFKISAMYGRFQKAVEYDSTNKNIQATYKRMGYGAKLTYQKTGYTIGMTMFAAKDNINSLQFKPDSLLIYPQQNLVTSFNVALRPSKGIEMTAEYAISALTKDLRDTTAVNSKASNILSSVIDARNSTAYYKAIKLQMNYNIKKTIIGMGYERIDPGYKTLGAYFFANDLENFTVNLAQIFFKNKLTVAGNFGVQKDDLDGAKSGSNTRYIGAANVNINPSQKLAISLNYSNFKTYMNVKPQFQFINQLNQFQNLDTLNFSQISQSANANVNYMLQTNKSTSQSLNVNLSMQDAVDMQGGVVNASGKSTFYNSAAAYNIVFVPKSLSITTAYNLTYNTIGLDDFTTQGPTLSVNSKWFKKVVTIGFSSSYNTSKASNILIPTSSVLNLRFNAGYTFLKKHNLLLSLMNQARQITGKDQITNLVGNLGYNFSF